MPPRSDRCKFIVAATPQLHEELLRLLAVED
jgi:hypothetical protein